MVSIVSCQKSRKPRSVLSCIKNAINDLDPCSNPIPKSDKPRHWVHLNRMDELPEALKNRPRRGKRLDKDKPVLRYHSLDDVWDHCQGNQTYGFTGNASLKKPMTLVQIDIDCHSPGSVLANAWRFASRLKSKFPDCYAELSTKGRGVHVYLFMNKGTSSAKRINYALDVLADWLRHKLVSSGIKGIDAVEVQGKCAIYRWDSAKIVEVVKSGTVGKLPRTVLDREDEFRACWDNAISIDDIELLGDSAPVITIPIPDARTSAKEMREWSGSISGLPIRPSMARQIQDPDSVVRRVVAELFPEINATKKMKVGAECWATFMVVMEFCSMHMNSDGTMPGKRIEEIWRLLIDGGWTSVSYQPSRIRAMRTWLSENGYLADCDWRYWIGTESAPGQACKWKLNHELLQLLSSQEENEEEESILIVTNPEQADDVVITDPIGVEELPMTSEQEYILMMHGSTAMMGKAYWARSHVPICMNATQSMIA